MKNEELSNLIKQSIESLLKWSTDVDCELIKIYERLEKIELKLNKKGL